MQNEVYLFLALMKFQGTESRVFLLNNISLFLGSLGLSTVHSHPPLPLFSYYLACLHLVFSRSF